MSTIVYVGSLELPDKSASANHAWTMGKLFRACGYETVFVGADRDFTKNTSVIETRKELDGVVYYTSSRRSFLFSIQAIVQVIEAIGISSVTAVIALNYPAISLLRLKRYCDAHGIAMMVELTEWYAANYGHLVLRSLRWLDIQIRMRYAAKHIHHIICISRYLERYYQRAGCHTLYVPAVLDKQNVKWAIEPFTYQGQRRRFIYAGKPTKKDSLFLVISALHDLMCEGLDFEFHILGATKDEALRERPDMIDKLNALQERIVFYGQVDHKQTISYIKGADFTVFMRQVTRLTSAGFPSKLPESLACGTPLITNRTSDIPDYIVSSKNGFLIDHFDEGELRTVLHAAIIMSDDDLNLMKTNCRNDQVFDYRSYISATQQFITAFIKTTQPP